MAAPGTAPRSVTIDRRRHRRIVRDLVLATGGARSGQWWAGALLAGIVVISVAVQVWYAGLVLGLGFVGLQLLVWWVSANRAARDGLAVGQKVTLAYEGEELVITDATGELRLPRGSVMLVRRTGANATVYGRTVAFVLPGELIDHTDVAFLEGHAVTGPTLPLTLEITEEVQARLLADATRFMVRTADFLLPYVIVLPMVLVGVLTPLRGFLVIAGLLFTITGVPGLFRFRRWRAAYRRGYPVGWTLCAQVTSDRLSVTWPHATRAFTWDSFDRVTATDHNVLLRRRRKRFGSFAATVLPLDLFRPEDIRLMASVVPRPR